MIFWYLSLSACSFGGIVGQFAARSFRDCAFAFVHPKKMNGVLLEVIDYKGKEFEDRD